MDVTRFSELLSRYGFDETDPLLEWINAGLFEVMNEAEWPFLRAVGAGIVVPAVNQVVTVPADFGKPIMLTDVTDGSARFDLEYIDPRRYLREVSTTSVLGVPSLYTILGDELKLWPASSVPRTVNLFYMKDVAELVNPGDSPTWLPDRWHYSPCVYAMAHIALMAENEEERAQTALAEQNAGIERMLNYYGMDQLGTAETVADVQGYFEGSASG